MSDRPTLTQELAYALAVILSEPANHLEPYARGLAQAAWRRFKEEGWDFHPSQPLAPSIEGELIDRSAPQLPAPTHQSAPTREA